MMLTSIQPSDDLGNGLFAERDFEVGEEVARFTGKVITFAEAVALGPLESHAMQIAPDVYILCDGHAVYTNHSCDPNAGIKDLVKLVAVRPISKGEQIFFDYSTTMDEDHYTMQCKCGVATCRRVVTDFKLLSEERQLHYLKLGVVQPFIVTPVVQRKLEQLKDWYNNHTNGSGLAHG